MASSQSVIEATPSSDSDEHNMIDSDYGVRSLASDLAASSDESTVNRTMYSLKMSTVPVAERANSDSTVHENVTAPSPDLAYASESSADDWSQSRSQPLTMAGYLRSRLSPPGSPASFASSMPVTDLASDLSDPELDYRPSRGSTSDYEGRRPPNELVFPKIELGSQSTAELAKRESITRVVIYAGSGACSFLGPSLSYLIFLPRPTSNSHHRRPLVLSSHLG